MEKTIDPHHCAAE